ncbi:MAG: outer membrane protein assembly factor BamA [Candidatus Midichloria sp.]|nr:outer membrane protein assembly factor BamA [Candidatus Midichloria sp.]
MNFLKALCLKLVILIIFNIVSANSYGGEIIVKGNTRIPKETIITYSGITNTADTTSNQIEAAIKNLYTTSFFADVKIEKKGANIIVTVEENPLIRKIAFEGNKSISDDSLKKVTKLQPQAIYLPSQIHLDSKAIETAYNKQGYYAVFVEPKIIKLPGNKVDLVYEIKQGQKAKIKRINFVGNENFTTEELKEHILSKEYAFYRFFSSADMYDLDKLHMDQELLKRFYQFNGYFDFEIKNTTAELTPSRDGFIITFLIEEGKKYKVQDFSVLTNVKGLPKDKLLEKISLTKNATLNLQDIEASEEAMTKYLGANGYAFSEVTHDVIKNSEIGYAIVRFIIKEGMKFYISKININNNNRTMDKVIRRKMKIEEGDYYSNTLIEKSKMEIINLGYFSSVDFKNKRTAFPDKVDIDIDVKETSTGSMNFLIGYNDQTGFMGSVSVAENNFLGKGQAVESVLSKASQAEQAIFSFTESGFFNQPIDAGFDLYTGKVIDKYSKYSNQETSGGLRMQYELLHGLYHGLRYNLKRFDISQSGSSKSLTVQDSSGITYNSSLGQTFSWGTLDSRIRPTKGVRFILMQDLAGLGGDTHYIKHQVIADMFFPLYKKSIVLNLSARAAAIRGLGNKRVRLMDNLYLEQDYLRGFEPNGISPRDRKTGNPIGAKNYCSGTAEISFPLGLPEEIGLNGVAFIDAASMFDYDLNPAITDAQVDQSSNIRSAYGVGIVWRSPFGKIKLNYGIPIAKEKFDNPQRVTLSIGGMF